MNTLLLFFALPIATIILSVVLQKILRSPVLVAATAFAIYLIITFAVFDETFLIFAIVYTILAFLAAYIAEIFFRRHSNWNCVNTGNLGTTENNNNENNNVNQNNNCSCQREVVTANLTNETTGRRSSWRCYRR